MKLGQGTARLVLVASLLVTAGCASRGGSTPLADSSSEVLPQYKPAQLMAAARQYEKEGRADKAILYYRQVLALDPHNQEAQHGLQLVQAGRLREKHDIDQLIAAQKQTNTPFLQSRENIAQRREELDLRIAELVAHASMNAQHVRREPIQNPLVASSGASRITIRDSAPPEDPASTPAPAAAPTQEQIVWDEPATEETTVSATGEALAWDLTPLPQAPGADEPTPADWGDDSPWKPKTLAALCRDAHAEVLREVAKLDSDDPATRKDGLTALATLGPEASSAALAVSMLLDDPDESVRVHAAWACWEIQRDSWKSLESLSDALRSADLEVVQLAAYTLGNMGDEAQAAVVPLNELLKCEHSVVRLHAAEAVTKIAAPADQLAALKTLAALASDDSADVRSLAVLTLGSLEGAPTGDIVAVLQGALHDQDARVRSSAALALGGLGDAATAVITDLEFVAANDQTDVREAAETALSCLR
jgi:tetratricopeptide (TPR) repeat protein